MMKTSLLKLLFSREVGGRRYKSHAADRTCHKTQQLMEEKSTLPITNQACELSGQCRSTFLMAFSPDRSRVASTHGDHTVRVTDGKTGKCTHILQGHPRTPWCIAFHPTSNDILATGCLAGHVRIWDLRGGGSECWKSEKGCVIASIAFHPTDQLLVIATSNELLFWDWSKPDPFATCYTANDYEKVRWVKFDPWGHNLYTGIANASTMQRDEVDTVNYIDAPGSVPASDEERRHLQEHYRRIVDEITLNQHSRVHTEGTSRVRPGRNRPSTSAAPQGNSNVSAASGAADIQAEIELVEPRSPSDGGSHVYPPSHNQHSYSRPPGDNESTSGSSEIRIAPNQTTAFEAQSDLAQGVEHQITVIRQNVLSEEEGGASQNESEATPNAAGRTPAQSGVGESAERTPSQSSAGESTQRTSVLSLNNTLRSASDERTPAQPEEGNSTPGMASAGLYGSTSGANVTVTTADANSRAESTPAVTQSAFRSSILRSRLSSADGANPGQGQTPHTSTHTLHRNTQPIPAQVIGGIVTNLPSSVSSVSAAHYSAVHSLPTNTISGEAPLGRSILFRSLQVRVPNARDRSGLDSQNSTAPSRPSFIPSHSGCDESCRVCGRYRLLMSQNPYRLQSDRRPRYGSVIPVAPSRVSRSTTSRTPATTSANTPDTLASLLATEAARNTLNGVQNQEIDIDNSLRELDTLQRVIETRSQDIVRGRLQASATASRPEAAETESTEPATELAPRPDGNFANSRTETVTISSSETSAANSGSENIVTSRPEIVTFSSPRAMIAPTSRPATVPSGVTVIRANTQPRRSSELINTISNLERSLDTSTLNRLRVSCENLRDCLRNQGETSTDSLLGNTTISQGENSDSRNENSANSDIANRRQRVFASLLGNSLQNPTVSRSENQPASRSENSTISRSENPTVSRNDNATVSRSGSMFTNTLSELLMRSSSQPTGHSGPSVSGPSHNPAPRVVPSLPVVARLNPLEPTVSAHESLGRLGIETDIDQRIQQLDDRLTEIQQRLDMRIRERRALQREHEARLSHAHALPNPGSTAIERIRERRERMLEDIRRRRSMRYPSEPEPDQEDHEHSSVHTSRFRDLRREIRLLRQDILRRREIRVSLLNQRRNEQLRESGIPPPAPPPGQRHTWRHLQRQYLHPDYSVSILDDTLNRQSDIQGAINRAIAGAFMANGEASVASNIVNLTHRIQRWDFTRGIPPDITSSEENVIVPHCKIHNDASCDISADGKLLSAFVPSHRGFPDDTILGVFSLDNSTLKQCLYTKGFGPNAISVSLSPLNNFALVGLAAKRLAWVFAPKQMVAQIFHMKSVGAGEDSMEHVCDLMHPCNMDMRVHVSVNSARWLPNVGEGIVYGTNRGDLHICRPGCGDKKSSEEEGRDNPSQLNLMRMFGFNLVNTANTSTQTQGVRRSASTQTDDLHYDSD